MPPLTDWAGPEDALGRYIARRSRERLENYGNVPDDVVEHANLEQDTTQGGYQHRQLFELVQNSADALSPASAASSETAGTSSAHDGVDDGGVDGVADGARPRHGAGSLAVHMIREHGRISTADGIVAFADALGDPPRNTDALLRLLRHPQADRIKAAFGLADPAPEFFGVHDPVPLMDVWPGLQEHLPSDMAALQLVRCERIRVGHDDRACLRDGKDMYLATEEPW